MQRGIVGLAVLLGFVTALGGVRPAAAQAPLVANAGGPYSGVINAAIEFNGGESRGINLSYAWDFGDGTRDTGPIVSKIYGGAGIFTVTLTVTDWSGRIAVARTIAAIGIAYAPLVSVAAPCFGTFGGIVCGGLPPSCVLTAYGYVCWAIPPFFPTRHPFLIFP